MHKRINELTWSTGWWCWIGSNTTNSSNNYFSTLMKNIIIPSILWVWSEMIVHEFWWQLPWTEHIVWDLAVHMWMNTVSMEKLWLQWTKARVSDAIFHVIGKMWAHYWYETIAKLHDSHEKVAYFGQHVLKQVHERQSHRNLTTIFAIWICVAVEQVRKSNHHLLLKSH